MSKNIVETDGPQMTSQYGAYALRAGLARLHALMRMHTHTRPGTHMHARSHAQACAHRPICNTYCFRTATMISERASVLRYTYIACLVIFSLSDFVSLFVEMQINTLTVFTLPVAVYF